MKIDRAKYMEFHASIKSTDPAYFMLCEDAKTIKKQQEQLRVLADAILIAHHKTCDFCPYTHNEPDCKNIGDDCNESGCMCALCHLSKSILATQTP